MLPRRPVTGRLRRIAPAAEQFQTQRDKVKAEPLRDSLHQPMIFGVLKLDDLAGIDVDQMVVVTVLSRFIACATTAKIAAFQNPLLFQKTHRPVDGGDGNPGIESGGAAIEFLDIGVI